jgi:hypothetical protein
MYVGAINAKERPPIGKRKIELEEKLLQAMIERGHINSTQRKILPV